MAPAAPMSLEVPRIIRGCWGEKAVWGIKILERKETKIGQPPLFLNDPRKQKVALIPVM